MRISLSPNAINPLNRVTLPAHRDEIQASMEENGWIGDPIVVVPCGDCYQSLTGSHRISAAIRAGLDEIPVEYVCDGDDLTEEQWDVLDGCTSTETICAALEEFAEDGAPGLEAAIALLQAEIEKENGW